MQAKDSSSRERRRRLLLVLVATALAGGVGVAVLLLALKSSSSDEVAATAPTECMQKWNSDENALTYARHNRTFHRYSEAQVGYLRNDGSSTTISSDPSDGPCVVVFPRPVLDPEIVAAGQIEQEDGNWTPLSEIIDPNQLAALQSTALSAANAQPTVQGELAPM